MTLSKYKVFEVYSIGGILHSWMSSCICTACE